MLLPLGTVQKLDQGAPSVMQLKGLDVEDVLEPLKVSLVVWISLLNTQGPFCKSGVESSTDMFDNNETKFYDSY